MEKTNNFLNNQRYVINKTLKNKIIFEKWFIFYVLFISMIIIPRILWNKSNEIIMFFLLVIPLFFWWIIAFLRNDVLIINPIKNYSRKNMLVFFFKIFIHVFVLLLVSSILYNLPEILIIFIPAFPLLFFIIFLNLPQSIRYKLINIYKKSLPLKTSTYSIIYNKFTS